MKIPVRQYLDLLQKYIKPQLMMVILLGFLLFGNIALLLINPQIIRNFIDAAQGGSSPEVLTRSALLFLGLALLQQFATVLANYYSEIVAWTATNGLRVDLADHCLRLDLSFHNTHPPGEIIERIDGDVNNLANFFSRFVVEFLGNGILLVGLLMMMWRENALVGLGLTVFVSLSMFIMLRYRDVAVPYWTAERKASADFYSFLEERLAGTEDIRANGAEAYVLRRFNILIREILRRSLKSAMVINVLININQFLFAVGTAAAFAIGTYLFKDAVITLGTVYLVYHYTSMLNRPMDNIAHQVEELQRAGAGIVRIKDLLSIQSRVHGHQRLESTQTTTESRPLIVNQSQEICKTHQGPLGLCFDQVTFGYDDAVSKETDPGEMDPGESDSISPDEDSKEIVLRDLSFELEDGKTLGLLGRTGSGKTTLTRLIFRFYDPDLGRVSISRDGDCQLVDIRGLTLTDLRSQVGMVTQNIQLFNASVRDNLTFFDPRVSDDVIASVIEALELGEWYQSLPEGLDTVLDSGGGGLSAGEAQLLAFTRIFLADPGLVVLDEASSRLDPATEALIERAVARLIESRTAVIIAHHLDTVKRADKIMILEAGQIEEFGDRESLLLDPSSRFSQLIKTGLEEVLV
jgi:ATP-binding cassette subfamily B protein